MAALRAPSQLLGEAEQQIEHTDNSSVYHHRWASLQIDGSLEAVDQAVEAMVCLTTTVIGQSEDMEDALWDLTHAACWTTLKLRRVLALDSTRLAELPFDARDVLTDVVGQFLYNLPHAAWEAIVAGVDLAQISDISVLPLDELITLERGYRQWASVRLMTHLIT
jgi:hypothetical protein